MHRFGKIGSALAGATFLLAATAATGAFAGETHQVIIEQFEFVPATLTVKAGDTVEFVNRDIVPHTASETDFEWDTEELTKGKSARIEFSAAGTTDYFCAYHPHMKGRIVVTAQ